MKRFKNILLVCDGHGYDQDALERGAWLAKKNNAAVTVVDAVDAAPGELSRLFSALPGARAHEVEDEVLGVHSKRLSEIAEQIRSQGIPTTQAVLQGIPFVEIIRKVLRDEHDLVIKGTGDKALGRSFWFTSTDLHLLRKCPCPVWLIQKGGHPRFARILAAVDPDPDDAQRNALNTLIMDLATSLSAFDGSDLHVVNAWTLNGEETLRHSGFSKVAESEIEMLVDRKKQQSERALWNLIYAYPDSDSRRKVHLLKGQPSEVIPEFAEAEKVDLIVMGTVGRTDIRGLIIGNTAEAILGRVESSVMAVKPPGFESPVQLEPSDHARQKDELVSTP